MTEEPETDYAKLTFLALVGYFVVGPLILCVLFFIAGLIGWLV